jgi:RNA polymerase sigma factor (sigma-70 family)
MDTSIIHPRLDNLTPRIFAYSNFIHSPELDNEDIRQEMYLALLEKTAEDPTFAEQSPSYQAWFATWQAKHVAEKARTYDGHVQDGDDEMMEIILCGHSDEDDDPASIAEEEEELAELLQQISALSPENQTVVKMTYLGYSTGEIAERLNISAPAVSQRKKTIKHCLIGQAG